MFQRALDMAMTGEGMFACLLIAFLVAVGGAVRHSPAAGLLGAGTIIGAYFIVAAIRQVVGSGGLAI